MKITLQTTLDGMVRTLRLMAHQAAEDAERRRMSDRRKRHTADGLENGRKDSSDDPRHA
ncbi:hypothetical protein [Nitratireductor sp. ZSWI3]|uniref:hypothetical protein n=1 Tax=Nitratireductor sp. ZSWI3 TaxID=2966359 RepID=UPI00214FBF0F|nr:hypothetical protein [Nitratireductor sp. ZSWI3]MCR4265353.1 hypothetical protein [Nitratireductor sp. ZSWI3]